MFHGDETAGLPRSSGQMLQTQCTSSVKSLNILLTISCSVHFVCMILRIICLEAPGLVALRLIFRIMVWWDNNSSCFRLKVRDSKKEFLFLSWLVKIVTKQASFSLQKMELF